MAQTIRLETVFCCLSNRHYFLLCFCELTKCSGVGVFCHIRLLSSTTKCSIDLPSSDVLFLLEKLDVNWIRNMFRTYFGILVDDLVHQWIRGCSHRFLMCQHPRFVCKCWNRLLVKNYQAQR